MATLSTARFQAALSDRYVIDDVVGSGGMGTVYLARDVKHGRPVAIKVVPAEVLGRVGARRFLREIRTMARLQHPHILPLLDSGEAAGCPYYVMPYVKDGSLRDLLNRRKRLGVKEALSIVRGVTDALEYAHENQLVHCDIKPENILLSAGHAVLADFGIARAARAEMERWRALPGSADGTPAYMSPEQASGERLLDAKSDVYSLACVLYEMLSGRLPFSGPTDQAIIARRFTDPVPDLSIAVNVPGPLAAVVKRALSVDPRRRYRSVSRFTRAVQAAGRSRRRIVAEWVILGGLRGRALLRSMVRVTGHPRRAARELVNRGRDSLQTTGLGAGGSSGSHLQGSGSTA